MIDSANVKNNNFLIIIGIAATIGSAVPVGYHMGVINNPALYISDWCNKTLTKQYDIYLSASSLDILWSAVVSTFLIGGAIGSFGGAWIADKYGRKAAMLLSSLLNIIGFICFIFCRTANSVEMLIFGRLFVGLASGLCTTTLPLYLTELAPRKLRGAFGTFGILGLTSGIVVSQILTLRHIFGTESLWHYGLSAYIILVLICYAPLYYYPESPTYLYIIRDDRDAALRVLQRLRNNNMEIINRELKEMENYKQTKTETKSFISVLTDPSLRLPLVIVVAYMTGQQLAGINAIFYYSTSIFKTAGLSETDAEWASLGAGCINLVAASFAPILMSNFNRRPLMMLSSGADAVLLLVLAILLYFINSFSWLPIAVIIVLFMYLICFQIALGSLPFFIGLEIFKTDSQQVGMAIGNISLWICTVIVGMSFPSLQTAWGGFVFMPFSVVCGLLFILTKLYLPETRNRDPSEVASLIANGFRSNIKY